MSDAQSRARFVRAVGLEIGKEGLTFIHDYGEEVFPWDSITFALSVIHRKNLLASLPLFFIITRDSPSFYYINGNTISLRFLRGDRGELDCAGAPAELQKSKEDDFKRIIREICSHFTTTHIDRPLLAYLKGSQFFLPTFSSQKEIAAYIETFATLSHEDEGKGAQLLEDDEDLDRLRKLRERTEWSPGTIIEGRYTVQEIFRGGMGIVYIVFDPETVEFYAMKTFQESFLWNEQIIEHFINEAEIWVRLEHHLHIVQARLVKVIEGKPYIFLEYVKGSDLEEILKEGAMEVAKAVELAIQFCDGMEYAYRKLGLIHRDIKPANCLVTKEGILKITDFGLGRIFDTSMTREAESPGELPRGSGPSTSAMVGTLPYMAPELFMKKPASLKTDMYAFGIVLYEMLAGINPFSNEDPSEVIMSHVSVEPDPPGTRRDGIPGRLNDLVLRCLAKDPDDRYDRFEEIMQELEEIYSDLMGLPFLDYQEDIVFSEEDWYNKGVSLSSLGRYREAILTFDRALALNSSSLQAIIQKGSALLKSGSAASALACLDDGMKMGAENWSLWFHMAEALWAQGSTREAERCFDEALRLTDDRSTVLGRKGVLLRELGMVDEALECFNDALFENPRAEEIWDEKGSLLISLNSFEEALECLNSALEINPRSLPVLYHRGLALFNLGFFPRALDSLKKALTLDPRHVASWITIGDCHREAGIIADALKAYSRAIELRPESMEAYYSSIALLKENKRWEDALELLEQALEVDPESATLLLFRAEVLMMLSFYDDALLCIDTIMENEYELKMENEPLHEEVRILRAAVVKWQKEQQAVLKETIGEALSPPLPLFNDLNSIICTFCNARDALCHMEKTSRQTPMDSYLVACLCFMERKYERVLQEAHRAAQEGSLVEKAMAVRGLAESRMKGGAPGGLLKGFFEKSAMAKRSADELFLLGVEKIQEKNYAGGREYLSEAIGKSPAFDACRFFFARSFDLEGEGQKAHHFYEDFITRCPGSMGFWKERLALGGITGPLEKKDAYGRWIRNSPGEYQPWLEYLSFLAENGYHEKIRLIASSVLSPSFSFWKGSEETSLHLLVTGFLRVYLARHREAMESFTRAGESREYASISLLGQGKCHEGLGEFEEALEVYARIWEEPAGSPYATRFLDEQAPLPASPREGRRLDLFSLSRYISVSLEAVRGHYEAALAKVDEALKKAEDNILFLNKKAQVLVGMKRHQEFLGLFNRITFKEHRFTPVRVLRCISLVDGGKYNDALEELSRLLAIEPINLVVLRNMGLLSLHMEKYGKALELYDKILAIFPLNYRAYLEKGITCYLMKEYDQARDALLAALRLFPTDPDLWQFMGATSFHLGLRDLSRHCWEKSLRFRSRFVQGWANMGAFLYNEARYRRAGECADRALRLDREYAPAWLLRARCQWKNGNLQDALKSAERALSFSPRSVQAWSLQGIVEFYLGNRESSLRSFEKATQLEQKNAILWYDMAVVALALTNQQEARRAVDRAVALGADMCEAHITRFVFEKMANAAFQEEQLLENAWRADPERFSLWQKESGATGNLFATLELVEVPEDPFMLPLVPSLATLEPITLFHPLL